eukprot:1185790-Prorocentrum_minimum.AAC.4
MRSSTPACPNFSQYFPKPALASHADTLSVVTPVIFISHAGLFGASTSTAPRTERTCTTDPNELARSGDRGKLVSALKKKERAAAPIRAEEICKWYGNGYAAAAGARQDQRGRGLIDPLLSLDLTLDFGIFFHGETANTR